MIHARSDYQRIQDPGYTDAAGKQHLIPKDEPVFLLRAQDQTAAPVLRHWIKCNRKLLKTQRPHLSAEHIKARQKALTLAEAHCYRFEDWAPQKPADC